jgi:hypothetical protein
MEGEEGRHLAEAKRCGIEVVAAPTLEVCNGMHKHAHVKHPKELIQEAKNLRRGDNRILRCKHCFRVDHQARPRLSNFL